MGIFDSTKKTYVSSVAYNMGGPLADRPNYMKSVVVHSVMAKRKSLADEIIGSQLNGPGMDQRSFYRWARDHYPEGRCQGLVNQALAVNPNVVKTEIEALIGPTIEMHAAFIDMGDISFFGERYLLLNAPARYEEAWIADFDEVTRDLVITFPGGTVMRSYTPGFTTQAKYIYSYYTKHFTDGTKLSRMFIYGIGGTNAALNALNVNIALRPEVFPIIPLRIDNKAIDHPDFASSFGQHAKAYKKSIGTDIAEVLVSIEDNANVGDIDFAYLVHGVELNSEEVVGKRYLYEFIKGLIPDQKTSPLDLANWIASGLGYTSQKAALAAWKTAQSNPANPLYGTVRPTVPARVDLEVSRFEVKTSGAVKYQTHIGWVTIQEDLGTGLGKAGAKVGDFWFEIESDILIPGIPFDVDDGSSEASTGAMTRFRLVWQSETAVYRALTVYGMYHENFVYDGKTVLITAKEALQDPDESGFVVALHYPTLKKMPMAMSTQLSVSNKIIVFNCYQIVKTHWYEKAIFRFLFALIIAAVAAVAFPAAAGILGSNLAVGTALGVSGTTALIVGGLANAVAAMVLVTIIDTGAVALFGEEAGAIIGTLAAFVAFQYAASYMAGGAGFNLMDMFKPENILKLTNAVTGGVAKWANYTVGDIQEDLVEAYDMYEERSDEIEKKSRELLGYGQGFINPLMFLQLDGSSSVGGFEVIGATEPESSATFLSRTLLTGSDIAEMSLALVRNFPEMSLTLSKSQS